MNWIKTRHILGIEIEYYLCEDKIYIYFWAKDCKGISRLVNRKVKGVKMKWMKIWADGGEPFETTYDDALKHLKNVYKDIEQILKNLPIKQKIRNNFAYYWKEEE